MFKRAVDLGYAPAMTALAKMQPEHAKELYEAAANAGEPEALFRAGKSRNRQHEAIPKRWPRSGKRRRPPRAGHVPSMLKLGWLQAGRRYRRSRRSLSLWNVAA